MYLMIIRGIHSVGDLDWIQMVRTEKLIAILKAWKAGRGNDCGEGAMVAEWRRVLRQYSLLPDAGRYVVKLSSILAVIELWKPSEWSKCALGAVMAAAADAEMGRPQQHWQLGFQPRHGFIRPGSPGSEKHGHSVWYVINPSPNFDVRRNQLQQGSQLWALAPPIPAGPNALHWLFADFEDELQELRLDLEELEQSGVTDFGSISTSKSELRVILFCARNLEELLYCWLMLAHMSCRIVVQVCAGWRTRPWCEGNPKRCASNSLIITNIGMHHG